MQKSETSYVGIDIGTTNTRIVIGVINEGEATPTIVGVGSVKTKGMRKGTIISVEDVSGSIADAIDEAERVSGQHISSATVSINGAHIVGLDSKGVIAISSGDKEITHEDLDRVEEAATVVQLPPNREILQVFARNYSLDGQQNIKEPLGMNGVRLEVNAHLVTAASPVIKSISRAVDAVAIGVNHQIVAGLAASEAVLQNKQRETGSVVVDFGAATTNVVVFEEDDVQHVAVLPIGSDNITNDLAIGLRTDIEVAEQVKISHAAAKKGTSSKKEVSVTVDGNDYSFKRSDIENIVKARLDELFELVDDELVKINRSGKLPGGVVLVGGGALLPELAHFVKDRLALPARVAKPRIKAVASDDTNSPAFAAAIGLMMLDLQLSSIRQQSSSRPKGISIDAGGILQTVKKFGGKFRTK